MKNASYLLPLSHVRSLALSGIMLAFVSISGVGHTQSQTESAEFGYAEQLAPSIATSKELENYIRLFKPKPGITDITDPIQAPSGYKSNIFFGTNYNQKLIGWSNLVTASGRGDSDAALSLGIATDFGSLPFSDSPSDAFKWYSESASLGNTTAQALVGRAKLYGIGTSIDQTEARQLLEAAFDKGATGASNDLANIHAYGLGVEKNEELATSFWNVANSSPNPQYTYDWIRYYSTIGSQDRAGSDFFSRKLISEDQLWGSVVSYDYADRIGLKYEYYDSLKKTHELGNHEGTARLAEAILTEKVPGYESTEGLRLAREAATAGSPLGMSVLGRYYLKHPEQQPQPNSIPR